MSRFLVWIGTMACVTSGLLCQDEAPQPLTIYFNGYVRGNFGPCT